MGITESELAELIRQYQENRDAFFAGPRLVSPAGSAEQIPAGEGDFLERFIERANAERAARPNPLKRSANERS